MATIEQLEHRMTTVENELREVKSQIPLADELKRPWVDRIYGAFENNDAFDQAMELGRKYRASQRPRVKKHAKTKRGA